MRQVILCLLVVLALAASGISSTGALAQGTNPGHTEPPSNDGG